MSQFPRQSHVCPRCRRPLGSDPQLTLEYLRELKKAERDPAADMLSTVNPFRLRALEAIATRVKTLDWEQTLTGHVLVGAFGWELLIQARDWLAAIDGALADGKPPPPEEPR